jgi:hypothetical protein
LTEEATTEAQVKGTVAPPERPETKDVSEAIEANIDAEVLVEAAEDAELEADMDIEALDINNEAALDERQNTTAIGVIKDEETESGKLENSEAGIGSDLFETTVAQLDAMLKLMSEIGEANKVDSKTGNLEASVSDRKREAHTEKVIGIGEANSALNSEEVNGRVEVNSIGESDSVAKEKEPLIEVISL